jgi:hypothetical protein
MWRRGRGTRLEVSCCGHAVSTALDQDGTYRDADLAERRREVTLRRREDGSGTVTGDLTAECGECLDTVLDTLAKPSPAADPDDADGGRDLRTPGQRHHDGLLAGMKLQDHQAHQRRRRAPVCGANHDSFEKMGLALHHDQRPPPLGPTRLDRPPTETETQPTTRPVIGNGAS